ncbi:hypothetical protein JK636_14415 [Clostridium sp. YIM B02515]|uniref:DUF3298 domain-containing protein n=1 Tax=Clostridium rhizosphaerae TaxID=2803861 RepID=A0ABS1TC42_9CLOT|nr:DUF3298 domain-containing protein [Clostridium rhizosphaerae]MBL4936944.1 hypothetical protein [Clostridium rhizosphaerae]
MKALFRVLIIVLAILLTGCHNTPSKQTEPNKAVPSNSSAPSSLNPYHTAVDIKLVKKADKTKYLLSNGIEIKYGQKSAKTSKGEISAFSPQFSGLKDKALEAKINKSLGNDIENTAKNYAAKASKKPSELSFLATLNANNLLCITFYDLYSPPLDSFLYRLTDGKKLELKDLFTEGTDYVSLINQKVVENMLSEASEEENILKEPFTTIKPNQKFSISPSSLFIIFDAGESGFAEAHTVEIPLSTIDDYVDITDRYSGTERKTQERSDLIVRANNIFSSSKGEIINKKIGELWCYYPQFSGLRNDSFEKTINDTIKDGVYKVANNNLWDSESKVKSDDKHKATVQLQTIFNHYGIICITQNAYKLDKYEDLNDFYKVYSFDLKANKIIDAKEILNNYSLKDKNFKESFTNLAKQNLLKIYGSSNNQVANKINSALNYNLINDKSIIYFRKYTPDDPTSIVIHLNKDTIKGITDSMECEVSIKDIVKIPPEDFFK